MLYTLYMMKMTENKINAAASYDYPASGQYNSTKATLEDGREMMINTQYSMIDPSRYSRQRLQHRKNGRPLRLRAPR